MMHPEDDRQRDIEAFQTPRAEQETRTTILVAVLTMLSLAILALVLFNLQSILPTAPTK